MPARVDLLLEAILSKVPAGGVGGRRVNRVPVKRNEPDDDGVPEVAADEHDQGEVAALWADFFPVSSDREPGSKQWDLL
jgi:hypothetical protein